MARGRFISRTIDDNLQLARCSKDADHLFRRMIPHLDVEGRMIGEPRLVKSECCQLRDEFTAAVITDCLKELASAVDHLGVPLLVWYEANGKPYLYFPGFEGQQIGLRKDREPDSQIPPPSMEALPWLHHTDDEHDLFRSAGVVGPVPEGFRQPAGTPLPISEKVEGGSLKKEVHPPAEPATLGPGGRPSTAEYPDEFEAIWGAYPQRAGSNSKREGFSAYTALLKQGVRHEALLDAVRRYAAFCRVTAKVGTELVMMVSSFFGPKRQGWRESWTPPAANGASRRPVSYEGGTKRNDQTARKDWASEGGTAP